MNTKQHLSGVKRFFSRNGIVILYIVMCLLTIGFNVFAEDMWTAANRIIRDVYGKIAALSTVLAGVMTVVAVIGAKMSSNQQKVDKSWDWLKRIWIAWMIINTTGGFISYIVPLFNGLGGLDP